MTQRATERSDVEKAPPAGALDLSIIIVNWNTRDLLADCLRSVYDTVEGLSFEVFVVDNASTDGSAAMVRERFPCVRLIENAENVGFARANNQGIAASVGEFVLLLNSDARLDPGAVRGLVDCISADARIGAVGPTMLNPDGSLQNSYGRLPSVLSEIIGPYLFDSFTKPWGRLWRLAHGDRRAVEHQVLVDRVSFACALARSEAFRQIGLLDERYVFYSEDYDWFLRLKRAGWRVVYYPHAQVAHHWGASSSLRSEWALRQLYASKRLYFAKHHGVCGETALRFGLAFRFTVKLAWVVMQWPIHTTESRRRMNETLVLLREAVRPLEAAS